MKRITLLLSVLLFCSRFVHAQEQNIIAEQQPKAVKEQPSFRLFREDENYGYLSRRSEYKKDFWDPVKYIPLDSAHGIFLSLGGQFRPRYEFFRNTRWGETKDDKAGSYSQRIAFYTDLEIGKYVRLYGELYHGHTTRVTRPVITEDDDADFHQVFLDLQLPDGDQEKLTLRIGRQEMQYGSLRMISSRETPNIRRSFDAARVMYSRERIKIDAFYGSEVTTSPKGFDNHSFKGTLIWGSYLSLPDRKFKGGDDFYYIGYHSDNSVYNDGNGKENRHTFGARRYGNIGSVFYFNTEAIYQFGKLNTDGKPKNISAFALEFDYHYRDQKRVKLVKDIGIKFDYTSGDRQHGDDRLQSFNPLFPNPTYFGALRLMTPVNLMDVHPSITFLVWKKWELLADCDWFWRSSLEDGVYIQPRILERKGEISGERFVGTQPSLTLTGQINRHIDFSIESSYFITGAFVKATGLSQHEFYFSNTVSYKF
jgi:hypothetical protein